MLLMERTLLSNTYINLTHIQHIHEIACEQNHAINISFLCSREIEMIQTMNTNTDWSGLT